MGTFPFVLCVLFYVLHVTLRRFRRARRLTGYGPAAYPIIGCLVAFYKNRSRLLNWYTELLTESPTRTIQIRRLGAPRTVVTANPKNVEYMLKTNFNNFPKGKPFTEILNDFLGRGMFNVDGDLWYNQRKLVSHEFSAKSLKDYVENNLTEELDRKLIPIFESLAMQGDQKVVDLQELLRRLGFDTVCKFSLGIDPCSLDRALSDAPILKAFDTAALISARRAASPISYQWKIKRMLGAGTEQELKNAVKEIHAFVTNIIRDKKEKISSNGKSHGEDLLSRMIMAGHEEEVVRDMMISFIMAGRDTTSAAMTWLFYSLSRHSDIEEELVKEIGCVEDQELAHYGALKELRLLEACIFETMRLYPPVAWDSKHAIVDDVLPDGTPVGAGDRVTYFPYGMGRMENLWGKDRLEFRPERWFVEPNKGRRGELKKESLFKFPVFQAGPRVCLGKELALIQMKYVVASILKRFQIKPVGSEQAVFVPLLTAHMAGGFKVTVRRRQPHMAR
ncbi:hypothetical protein RJ639_030049 [Escallonia herrerae]|uniref:Cytochrome P450 n=1 Tax=Escallonia herrerae TaxID=1293975 RepID=A0AA89BC64_9ASTE|nr:hypothetical protein RJ639_030049 [Escallonia herrerae]